MCSLAVLLAMCWTFGSSGLHGNVAQESQPAAGISQVYLVGELWTGQGPPISQAALVVREGKIQAVGPAAEVSIPPGSEVHDWRAWVMIPGLIAAETSLAEGGADDQWAVAPEVEAVDGFDFFAPRHELLAAGLTTVQIAPGTARLMPGQGSVVKLAGDAIAQRVLKRNESMRILLTEAAFSPPTIYEPPVGPVSEVRPLLPTRPQLAGSLSGAVSGLQALLDAAAEIDLDGDGDLDELPLRMLAEARRQNMTFRITARSYPEILAAAELAHRYELPTVLVQPRSAAAVAGLDWDAELWRGVVLSPGVRPGRLGGPWGLEDPDDPDAATPAWDLAVQLVDAGLEDRLALRLESDQDLPQLRYLASLFQQAGLTPEQILAMLTSNPARIMGVADRVGQLSVGLDADFVLLNGPPFQNASRVEATYMAGQQVYRLEASPRTRVVTAAAIHADGQVISPGRVAVREGKIAGLGSQVSLPGDAQFDHFPDGVIVPGLIDLASGVGIGGTLSERLGLQIKLGQFLQSDDPMVAAVRRGGITTALLSSSNLPSPVVAFKLNDQPRVLKDPVAIRFEVKGNLTQAEASLRRTLQSGKTYHETWVKYEADMQAYQERLKEYEAALARYESEKRAREGQPEGQRPEGQRPEGQNQETAAESSSTETSRPAGRTGSARTTGRPRPSDGARQSGPAGQPAGQSEPGESAGGAASPGEQDAGRPAAAADEPQPPTKPEEPRKPREQEGLEPYRQLLQNQIVAIVEAEDAPAIRLALKLFRQEFGFDTLIAGGAGLEQVVDEVAAAGAAFVTGPALMGTVEGRTLNYPQLLAEAQVPFAFQSKATTSAASLPMVVGYAVHQGLAGTDALAGLTQTAAQRLQLPGVGRLAVAQDADLVVLSGPPFEPGSRVLAVMIDGQWVYRRNQEP